jgi:transposase
MWVRMSADRQRLGDGTFLIAQVLEGHRGYRVVQQISGIGPVFASIFVAEIGDPVRFATADKLTSWAAVEAVQRSSELLITAHRTRVADRGGRPGKSHRHIIAEVAAPRVLLKFWSTTGARRSDPRLDHTTGRAAA